jgi:SAM-dependent methyltransferase
MMKNENEQLINCSELISKYPVEDFCEAAEEYFKRISNWDEILSKPFRLTEVQHLLLDVSFLIRGLNLFPRMTILDFGCGTCWTSRILNQLGLKVISLDVSDTALKIGKKLIEENPVFGKQPELQFLHFDGKTINLPDNSVDRIFCLDAFHHVPNPAEILCEMSRVLKDGGIAGFSEPGPYHSLNAQSQFEMRNFKVVERDIVLEDILLDAQAVGFTNMRCCVSGQFPEIVSIKDFYNYFDMKENVNFFVNNVKNRSLNYPIFFLDKGNIEVNDSRNPDGLTAQISSDYRNLSFRENQTIEIEITFVNCSDKIWLPSGSNAGSVNIGAFLFTLDDAHNDISSKEYRFHLSDKEINSSEILTKTLIIEPLPKGKYRMEIDLVSEFISWFSFNDSKILIVNININ